MLQYGCVGPAQHGALQFISYSHTQALAKPGYLRLPTF